jgi:hypothetical protein
MHSTYGRSENPGKGQKQHEYVIKGQIDLSQIPNLDRSVPLRVAAVRDNRILQSQVIKLEEREGQAVDFDLHFQLPRPRCGLHLVIGRGDVKETTLLGLERFDRWIPADQWEESEPGKNPFVVDVGSLVIPEHIYSHWLVYCRKYTVRGRVVCRRWFYDPIEQQWTFIDQPVPGATVEAYDVDCWWWWCFKDLIGSAVTGLDGSFEINFTWCCRSWFPFHLPWIVNPDLLERIRELLAQAKVPIPLPDPPPDPFEFQEYVSSLVSRAQIGGQRFAALPMQASSEPIGTESISAQQLMTILPPSPELEALHIWPWWHRRDCSPDILFRVTQPCEGSVQVVYEEGYSQTRWNVPQTLNVVLEANQNACCLPDQPDPPCGDCLAITQVGCTDIANIGIDPGPPDLRGYAYPNTHDRPFGGRVGVKGEFGEDSHPIVDFYRVEYHKDGMSPGTWIDMGSIPSLLRNISRRYHDPSAFSPPYQSPPVDFGPMLVDGKHVYKTKYKFQRDSGKPSTFSWIWTNPDSLFGMNTNQLPEGDGLYTFRIVGYRQASDGTLVDERVMPLCGAEDEEDATVMLRFDNQNVPHAPSTPTHPCGPPDSIHVCTAEPDCDFISLIKNEGTTEQTAIPPCADVTIADTDDITIHFSVTTPPAAKDAHLLAYELSIHYAESGLINIISVNPESTGSSYTIHPSASLAGDPTPEKGPTYQAALTQGAIRPHWDGGNFKITLQGSVFPISCAYLLQLRAWERTYNGCSNPAYFHSNICEYSFCLVKP